MTSKITKDSGTTFETVEYKYNLQNRLSRVETYNGSAVLVTATDYRYNPDGIRVEKSVDGVSTQYLIDPQNHTGYAQVLEEITVDGSSMTKTSYVIGDDVLSQTKSTSTDRFSFLPFYFFLGHFAFCTLIFDIYPVNLVKKFQELLEYVRYMFV